MSAVFAVVVLTVFWTLLWGSATPATILSGVLVAGLLYLVRPRVWSWSVRPVGLLKLVALLTRDLAATNVAMARAVLIGGNAVEEHIVQVDLRRAGVPVDQLISLLVTLTPGTTSVGLTRMVGGASRLTVHALRFQPDQVRDSIHELESAVLAAVATHPGRGTDGRPRPSGTAGRVSPTAPNHPGAPSREGRS